MLPLLILCVCSVSVQDGFTTNLSKQELKERIKLEKAAKAQA